MSLTVYAVNTKQFNIRLHSCFHEACESRRQVLLHAQHQDGFAVCYGQVQNWKRLVQLMLNLLDMKVGVS